MQLVGWPFRSVVRRRRPGRAVLQESIPGNVVPRLRVGLVYVDHLGYLRYAVIPPSTTNTCPVTNDASFEARYRAANPISSGWPMRGMGCVRSRSRTYSGFFQKYWLNSVWISPGAIAFTRTP